MDVIFLCRNHEVYLKDINIYSSCQTYVNIIVVDVATAVDDDDINTNIANPLLYADGTRNFRGIKGQEDLNKIYTWTQYNNMKFNDSKFAHIKFGNSPSFNTSYNGLNGAPITTVTDVKDLAVTLTSNATFDTHIEKLRPKCKQVNGYALRIFQTRDSTTLLTLWNCNVGGGKCARQQRPYGTTLWKTIILPHIDYCSQLWDNHKQTYIQLLEGLQRTFTSCIRTSDQQTGDTFSYWQRLEKYNLYSIGRRMERYQIIYTWKVLENQVVSPRTEPIIDVRTHKHQL